MKRMLFVIGASMLMLVSAVAQEPAGEAGYAAAVYGYTCAGGTSIRVAYVNIDDGPALAVLSHDGKLLVMENVVSASGARYATTGGRERYVWWADGPEGFLQKGPDGEEEFVEKACQ